MALSIDAQGTAQFNKRCMTNFQKHILLHISDIHRATVENTVAGEMLGVDRDIGKDGEEGGGRGGSHTYPSKYSFLVNTVES